MTWTRKHVIHEGQYAAEIDVAYEEGDGPWGPIVAKEDVFKTDRIRLALRRGDAKEAKVFEMLPLKGK